MPKLRAVVAWHLCAVLTLKASFVIVSRLSETASKPVLLFVQLAHIHEVILWRLPMSLTQVKLDRVLARKCPITQFALIKGAAVVVLGRGQRRFGGGQRRG